MAGTIKLANILVNFKAEGAKLLAKDIQSVQDKTQKMGQSMQSAGKKLTSFGSSMSARVSLPLAAAGAAAVKMASDAEEAANKFNVVMGPATDAVRARLEELTSTIPLTRSEMEGLAAGIQDMLVPMGVAREEAAFMSADMVQLAGDLGSFNNVGTDQVLEAMQSALAGASEPMRRFGVDTRVARLEALALREGLIKQGEELNNTSRAQAVLLAIQEDSTDAMGDAARTVDSTANSMKFLVREVKQLAIDIGNTLLPVVTPMIQKLRDAVTWFGNLSPGVKTAGVAVAGLAAALGPLITALGVLITTSGTVVAAAAKINPTFALATAAFASVANAVRVVIEHWDVLAFETKRAMKFVVKVIRTVLVKPFAKLVDGVIASINFLIEAYNTLARKVGKDTIPKLSVDVLGTFDDMMDGMGDAVRIGSFELSRRFTDLKDDTVDITREQTDKVKDLYSDMKEGATKETVSMADRIAAEMGGLRGRLAGVNEGIKADAIGATGELKANLEIDHEAIRESTEKSWGDMAESVLGTVKDLVGTADGSTGILGEFGVLPEEMSGIISDVGSALDTLKSVINPPEGSTLDKWKTWLTTFADLLVTLWDKVKGFIDQLGDAFFLVTGGGQVQIHGPDSGLNSGGGGPPGSGITVPQNGPLNTPSAAFLDQIEKHTRALKGLAEAIHERLEAFWSTFQPWDVRDNIAKLVARATIANDLLAEIKGMLGGGTMASDPITDFTMRPGLGGNGTDRNGPGITHIEIAPRFLGDIHANSQADLDRITAAILDGLDEGLALRRDTEDRFRGDVRISR